MKTILLLTTLGLGSFFITDSAQAADFFFEQPVNVISSFVSKKDEVQQISQPKQVARIQVEYIVNDNNKNYVIYIHSTHPELHQKIINMISNMPVDPFGKSKKHNLVIEHEL